MSRIGFQSGESYETKRIKVQIVVITNTFVNTGGKPELISDQPRDEKQHAIRHYSSVTGKLVDYRALQATSRHLNSCTSILGFFSVAA